MQANLNSILTVWYTLSAIKAKATPLWNGFFDSLYGHKLQICAIGIIFLLK